MRKACWYGIIFYVNLVDWISFFFVSKNLSKVNQTTLWNILANLLIFQSVFNFYCDMQTVAPTVTTTTTSPATSAAIASVTSTAPAPVASPAPITSTPTQVKVY